MDKNHCTIRTWRQFAKRVRPKGCCLLKRLDQFQNSILVTGCQRSGTTVVSRVITCSDGMVNYWFGQDDELDAALILAGEIEIPFTGRHCFQTTYLNECYKEYFDHLDTFRMMWVLRNPFSVVFSLLYNWRRWTLNELFEGCGSHLLDIGMAAKYRRFGHLTVPRIIKACLSYNGKVSQLFELKEKLNPDKIKVLEYDDLVLDPQPQLKKIYAFIELEYKERFGELIHGKSTKKKDGLPEKEIELIDRICTPIYEKAKKLIG